MNYFLTYSFLILLFSCSTSIKDSPKTETKELEEKATIKNSKNKGTKASGLTKKREFQIQPIQLVKTVGPCQAKRWKWCHFERCYNYTKV